MATLEDVVGATIAEPRFQSRLLALSLIGIYGMLAYPVAERTHQIGVAAGLAAAALLAALLPARRAAQSTITPANRLG